MVERMALEHYHLNSNPEAVNDIAVDPGELVNISTSFSVGKRKAIKPY